MGNTALHICFSRGFFPLGEYEFHIGLWILNFNLELLADRYLLSKGADDTIRNCFGETCYDGVN